MALDADGIERFRRVEIELNSVCDICCESCDRFIPEAPTANMTLGQLRHFFAESYALDWHWHRIHILGGEPTLHPQLRDFVTEALRYRARYPCQLTLLSNGSGRLAEHRQWLEDRGVRVAVESKGDHPHPWFCNMRIAPVDATPPVTVAEPCSIFGIEGCGLGFTRHGLFLCGAGASIARVAGLDIGLQRLADVTYARMAAQARQLCHLCGHLSTATYKSRPLLDTLGVVSPTWQRLLARYREAVPPMTLYPGEAL